MVEEEEEEEEEEEGEGEGEEEECDTALPATARPPRCLSTRSHTCTKCYIFSLSQTAKTYGDGAAQSLSHMSNAKQNQNNLLKSSPGHVALMLKSVPAPAASVM